MTYEEMQAALGGDALASQAANCLWREYTWHGGPSEITIGFLCSLSRDDLMDIRNFGPSSLKRVQAWLKSQGRSLREDV